MFLTFDFRETATTTCGRSEDRSLGETHVGSASATDLQEECREHPGEDGNIMFCGAARDAQLPCPVEGSDLILVI